MAERDDHALISQLLQDLAEAGRDAAAAHGILLEVVKVPADKRGVVLLPRRGVVERDFARLARFRRLARDSELLAETVEGLTFVAFACLMLQQLVRACSS